MIEKSIEIKMAAAIDARPIAMLVQVASRYESSIYIKAESKKVNAKSIMGMMSLTLDKGETVMVVADGSDEEAAVNGIGDYLSGKAE